MERTLEPRTPPTRGTFPGFSEMTEEIENQHFEHLDDIGWDFEEHRHFYRVFNEPNRKMQASICLAEQQELAFYYLTLTTRTKDGRVFMTWNYPFSYGLKLPPHLKIHRFSGHGSFPQMLAMHEQFLKTRGVESASVLDQTPEKIVETMQNEMRAQITHNLKLGLLRREGDKLIRYTTRGMFYLWFQFLRDLIRFS